MPALKDRVSNVPPTEKQLEVLELLERRFTIAEIAFELGISASAVNQRIKLLKSRFGVNSHRELVECYRHSEFTDCTIPTGTNRQLPELGEAVERGQWDDQGSVFRFDDSMAFSHEAPWIHGHEPRVVPGVLYGEDAGGLRLVVIVSMVVGLFTAIILALVAAKALTEFL